MNIIKTYEKDIYVLFYTELIELKEVQQGQGYHRPIGDLFSCKDGSSILTNFQNYFQPPFSHCKLAFKQVGSNQFETYSFTGDCNFKNVNGDFLVKPGYSVLKIPVTDSQIILLRELIDAFVDRSNTLYMSLWKSMMLGGRFRSMFCLGPPNYPNFKTTANWTCSEFVCFCLQQSGIIDSNNIHPSLCGPVHLFYEILYNSKCNIDNSFNPFTLNAKHIININVDDTNAYKVFCKIMGMKSPEAVSSYGEQLMNSSLCTKLKLEKESLTLFSAFNSLEERLSKYSNTPSNNTPFRPMKMYSGPSSIDTPASHAPMKTMEYDRFKNVWTSSVYDPSHIQSKKSTGHIKERSPMFAV